MRPRQARLAVLFDRLTTLTLAGATSLACGGSIGPKIDPAAFPEAICAPGPYLAVHGLAVPNLDYIALRQVYTPTNPTRPFVLLDEDGVACASAKNRSACTGTLAALQSETGFPTAAPGLVEYFVTTAGDTVSAITDEATLLAAIGPIDNARKAALLVALNVHQVSCDVTKARRTQDGGYDVLVVDYGPACGQSYKIVEHVAPDGTVTELDREQNTPPSSGPCGTGRRPEGLAATGGAFDRDVGAFFAEVAHLEAASVTAFTRLARELAAHRAPGDLVRGAERAARDEVRHARTIARLARRFGASPRAPRIAKARRRSLEAIARENAVEGCVRETFGALLATWQSRVAEDRTVRAAMRGIARDETAHAELSWELARWLDSRLSRAARARVEQARRDAIGELARDLSRGVAESIQRAAGVPSPRVARTLFDGVSADLWAT